MASMLQCSETLTTLDTDISFTFVFSSDSTIGKKSDRGFIEDLSYSSLYLPDPSYALSVQKLDRFISYRQQAYEWMINICKDRRFSFNVAYTAMNYFDRYLSKKVIQHDYVELLEWCCLHIASAVFDNRTTFLNSKQVNHIVNNQYSKSSVQLMIMDILSVLDFHLLPPSPYDEGCKLLVQAGYTSLIPTYQSFLNGICSSYKSIGLNYQSIARVCILLVWSYSFPGKPWPESFTVCERVFARDSECIIQIVKELFPMKRDCCESVASILFHSKENTNSSPTSVALISYLCLLIIQVLYIYNVRLCMF